MIWKPGSLSVAANSPVPAVNVINSANVEIDNFMATPKISVSVGVKEMGYRVLSECLSNDHI
jgi:hypothetical protein